MNSKPYLCIFNVITDHEAQNILSCHQIAVFHMFAIRRCAACNYCTYSSSLMFSRFLLHINAYICLFLCPPPSSLPTLPGLFPPHVLHCSCVRAGTVMEGWREAQRRRGADRELRASICPIAFQVGQSESEKPI